MHDDCEAMPMGMNTKTDKSIEFNRRRALIALAQDAVERLRQAGVQSHEWCFVKRAASMMVEG